MVYLSQSKSSLQFPKTFKFRFLYHQKANEDEFYAPSFAFRFNDLCSRVRNAKQTTNYYVVGKKGYTLVLLERRFSIRLPREGKAFLFCKWLLQCKSQRFEPPVGSIGLLALVHTTRLTGGYDCNVCSVFKIKKMLSNVLRHSRPILRYFQISLGPR